MSRILLVEDEPTQRETLSYLLQGEGFQVTEVDNGTDALTQFFESEFDLVLLDVMLPGKSGTDICREIRKSHDTPIIMLTARSDEVDVVVGLELGADDYIIKPYSARELIARIRSALRRPASSKIEPIVSSDETVLHIGRVTLDEGRHELKVDGVQVAIPLREFELLAFLMRNAGRVLTRAQLIDRVWGSDYFGDTKTLDVHVKRIRARIEQDPSQPTVLVTVRGLGYRFEDS